MNWSAKESSGSPPRSVSNLMKRAEGERRMVSVRAWLAVGETRDGSGEAALLVAGRAGDPAALEQLLALHQRALHRLCLGVLGHPEEAEDAVQETFLRALRSLSGFRGEAAFRTWLFRIALNLCLRWKASRPATEPWDEAELSTPLAASPEAIALRHLRMREALARLMPRQRAVLLLKEREGWSVAEIGQAMGWKPSRVEYELHRARRALIEWRRREAGEGDER
jgi:RNA polymerase sigma-70 factor, ECF subfamily